MARKKNGRKKGGTRKKFNRRRKSNKNRMVLQGHDLKGIFGRYDDPNPFPNNLFVKFRYTDMFFVNGTNSLNTVGATTYKFGLNAPYGPLETSAAVKPIGYTLLLNEFGPYRRYKCNGCRINIQVFDPTADSAQTFCAVVRVPGDTTTISGKTLSAINVYPNSVTKFIPSSGTQQTVINQYFPMYKLFGITKSQFDADIDTTTGAYDSRPGARPILEIGCCDPRAAAIAVTLCVRVTIEYSCMLYQRYTEF